MSLGIGNATVGYDVNGMQSLINEINVTIIPTACQTIRSKVQTLRTTIDSVWVGASAEAFKSKLDSDTEALTKALEDLAKAIDEQLNTVGSNVEDYDNALAEQIKNWN